MIDGSGDRKDLTTGGLAEDCDPRGVSAKGCNVVSYPFDRKTLIKQSYVLSHSWKSREAENIDTVAGFVRLTWRNCTPRKTKGAILLRCLLCSNNYDIFAICKVLSIEYRVVRLKKCQLGELKRIWMTDVPSLPATPVDPEKDGLPLVSRLGFGPDVKRQAILALLLADLVDLSKQADSVGTRQSSRVARTGGQIGRAVSVNRQSATTSRSPEPRSSITTTYGD